MKSSENPSLTSDLAAILPTKARTFSLAAHFLPEEQRQAVIAVYAFCRTVDDLVDEPPAGAGAEEIRARLAEWRQWLVQGRQGIVPEPCDLAGVLRETIERYQIPSCYFLALLDGVESDLDPVRLPDFPSLYQYCLRVAGSVGLAMCHLLDARQPETLAAAAALGVAMQLTNILRDMGEDLRCGRIYLPADEIAQFGFSAQSLLQLAASRNPPDPAFQALIRFQIARVRAYYSRGLTGVWLLPREARTGILVAGRLYRAILDAVEASGYDVLRRRVATSRLAKLREVIVALALVRLWGDGSAPAGPVYSLDEMGDVFAWRGS